jgi:hypothetical protein
MTDGDLKTAGDYCHQVWDTEIAPQNLRLSKHTDMTIHWKAIEEHFLVVSLVFFYSTFCGENTFLIIL